MSNRLLTNKFLLIGLGIIAIGGLLFISYTATKNTSSPTTNPSLAAFQPKTAMLPPPVKDSVVTGQIIVKFKPQYTQAQINEHLKQYHASISKTIQGINQTVVTVPSGQETTIMQQLQTDTYVQTAQRDYTTHAFFVPNDPGFSLQYALKNTGQNIQGKTGVANADMHIETAWDVTRGNGIKVAILDTGINLNQPDLSGKVVLQKSFISNTVEDGNGHGTHVAGIVAADTNNSTGISGTCPDCQLLVGKVLDDSGEGTTSNATAGITWAADNGAKVINVSFGTTDPQTTSLYAQAVTYAISKGAIVVAAAGNDGTSELDYPASVPGVISVAATNNKDQRASFSNFGSTVQIAAPGDTILSTSPTHAFQLEPFGYTTNSPYIYLSGTSMATPYVSGVAALVASTPFGTTPQALTNRLYTTADKITGTGSLWKNGRVNAELAVGLPPTATVPAPTQITPTLFCVGGNGTPPCASLNSGVTKAPPVSGIPNQAAASGAPVSSAPSLSVLQPSGAAISISPNPVISGIPGNNNGNTQICQNLKITNAFYNLKPQQPKSSSKIHIKCAPGGKNGQNPHNGGPSKFVQWLLQLLQQLFQQLLHCVTQSPGTITPLPSISATPSGAVSPSQQITAPSAHPAPTSTTPHAPTPTVPITSSSCTNPAHVLPMTSDAQAGITLNGFYLTNDTWNASKYQVSQTMSICNYNNWFVTATMNNNSGDGAVKTYPNVHEDINKSLSSFKTITSTFAESGPHVGIYEFAYDLWLNGYDNGSTEVMIWNDNFGQSPSGSKRGTFTDNGHTYDIWTSGSGYVAFVAQSNFTSGTVNILNFFNYLIAQGIVKANPTVTQLDYGIELVSTNNAPAVFKVTNFSLTAN